MSRCDLCELSLEEHLLNHTELVFCENKFHYRSLSSLNILKYSAENFPLECVTITGILIYFKVNSFFISFQNKCIFRNLIFFQLWYIVPFLSAFSEEKKMMVTLDSFFLYLLLKLSTNKSYLPIPSEKKKLLRNYHRSGSVLGRGDMLKGNMKVQSFHIPYWKTGHEISK